MMAAGVGNLAIIISGNAKPFQQTLANVNNSIKQFSAQGDINIMKGGGGGAGTGGFSGMGGPGRFLQSTFVKAFGGGLTGALAGVAIGGILRVGEHLVGAAFHVGHAAASFLMEALNEGIQLSRQQFALNFLAGGPDLGAIWMQQIRALSQQSGFGMKELHHSAQTLAGGLTDVGNTLPVLSAIAEISAGIGADSDQMNRFALAVTQVAAKGRFMAQELNQLTDAGLPLKELAATAKLSVGEFRQAVENGTVSSNVLIETLQRLTGPGGRFGGMMQKMAETSVGQINQITSKWEIFKSTLGMDLMQSLNDQNVFSAINQGLTWLLDHKEEVRSFTDELVSGLKDMAIFAATFAGNMYDAAMMMWHAAQGLNLMWKTATTINPMLRLLFPAGELLNLSLSGGGTGEKWAAALKEAFDKKFFRPVKDSLAGIKVDHVLSPNAAKAFADLKKEMLEGVTGFQKYQYQMGLLREVQNFKQDAHSGWDTDLILEAINSAIASAFKNPAGLMGRIGSVANAGMMGPPERPENYFMKWWNGRDQGVKQNDMFDRNLARDPNKYAFGGGPQSMFEGFNDKIQEFFQPGWTQRIAESGLVAAGVLDVVAGSAGEFGKMLEEAKVAGDKQAIIDFGMANEFLKTEKALADLNKFPKAMEFGSADAASTIMRAMSGNMSTQDRVAFVLAASKDLHEQQLRELQDIAREMHRREAMTGSGVGILGIMGGQF